MALAFSLKDFSGPLDLLLHLIGNAKIDIKDIFVSQVTDQYIQIISENETMDMDEASEFIQMAATLLLIKSRSILPPTPTGDEEDAEESGISLIRQLEEYARFQQLAAQMQEFEQASSRLFSKLPDEFPLPPPVIELEGLSLAGLMEAMARLSARLLDREEVQAASNRVIKLDRHSVARCMHDIMQKTRKGEVSFFRLFSQKPTRNEIVTLFLALLELLKQNKLSASQDLPAGDILISRKRRGERHHEE